MHCQPFAGYGAIGQVSPTRAGSPLTFNIVGDTLCENWIFFEEDGQDFELMCPEIRWLVRTEHTFIVCYAIRGLAALVVDGGSVIAFEWSLC